MDVSIIIVNYNTRKLTQECIDSIFQYTEGVIFEVIVVDNASTDDSKAYFEKDNRIRYIYNTENLGFGRANNIGYQYATGKYLFLLNSDTRVLNNAVKIFFETAENEKDKAIGCYGTMLYDSNMNIAISYGRFLSLWKDLIYMFLIPFLEKIHKSGFVLKEYNYETKNGLVDFISGADIFMRKQIADDLGLFDPNYFLYCEETDMQKTYASFGFLSKIISSPKIIHFNGGSQNRAINLKMNIIKLKSKVYYFKKWSNPVAFYIYLIAQTIIKIPIFMCSKKYPSAYRKEYLKALWMR